MWELCLSLGPRAEVWPGGRVEAISMEAGAGAGMRPGVGVRPARRGPRAASGSTDLGWAEQSCSQRRLGSCDQDPGAGCWERVAP